MTGETLVSLRNDIIFKVVFGYEKNEKILISLLNETLGLEGNNRIIKLKFLNTFNIKEYLKDKLTSLDVKVSDGNDNVYNVEMQVEEESSFINRIIYYHDKLYTSQLKQSEPYHKLLKSVSISILNFRLLDSEAYFHNIYRYLNIASKNELTDLKEIHFIELPKFNKKLPEELQSKFEKWVYMLKYGEIYADEPEEIPEELKEEEIVMALRELKRASEDDNIREILAMREKARHDEISRLYSAKQEGIAEGKIEGRVEGKIEGRVEGRVEGKAEGTIENARDFTIRLIKKKFDDLPIELETKIRKCSDLSKLAQITDIIFNSDDISDFYPIFE